MYTFSNRRVFLKNEKRCFQNNYVSNKVMDFRKWYVFDFGKINRARNHRLQLYTTNTAQIYESEPLKERAAIKSVIQHSAIKNVCL